MARVLVVEDTPDGRILARVVLEDAGFQVEEAASGTGALERLGRAPKPDVVLLDLKLPGIDGWSVLRALDDGSPPVVIVSGDETALKSGHPHVLIKPYRPGELLAAVKAALRSSTGS